MSKSVQMVDDDLRLVEIIWDDVILIQEMFTFGHRRHEEATEMEPHYASKNLVLLPVTSWYVGFNQANPSLQGQG